MKKIVSSIWRMYRVSSVCGVAIAWYFSLADIVELGIGEHREAALELQYTLDGLADSQPVDLRRQSAMKLLTSLRRAGIAPPPGLQRCR